LSFGSRLIKSLSVKIIVLILTLFFSQSLKSQIPVEAFTDALKSKKFSAFKKVFKKALQKDGLIEHGNSISREIFEDYKEVYYDVYARYPVPGNTYTVKMIVKGNKMIYYHFSFVNMEKQGEKRIFTTVPVDTFTDVSAYNTFKANFRKVYEADLKETDLWMFKAVGQVCGFMHIKNLQDYDDMEYFINANKRDSLLALLESANLEKQMFGLWGYNILLQKQGKLSTLESRLIRTIMAKKAKGMVCTGGCDMYADTPKGFAKRYKLNELPN